MFGDGRGSNAEQTAGLAHRLLPERSSGDQRRRDLRVDAQAVQRRDYRSDGATHQARDDRRVIIANDRFMSKTIQIPIAGCWLWTAYLDKAGYGMFWLNGTMRLSHRVAFELFRGSIPQEKHVCHSCDVRSCVNPAHLWLGTNDENIKDKVRKQRQAFLRGENHPNAKLTAADVLTIRASVLSTKQLVDAYGLERSTIKKIRSRRLWGHL